MTEIDFFSSSAPRSAHARKAKIARFVFDPTKRADFIAYGHAYFDDPDYGVGYGSYRYDGRYADSARRMIEFYKLAPGSKVLEIGCAKGFVLYEFLKHGMEVNGIDLSAYAVANALPEVRNRVAVGSAHRLPWDDRLFDFVYSKETLPHLTIEQIRQAISEAMRVCRSTNIFLEIQVAEESEARDLFLTWDETHQTIEGASWWRALLYEMGFPG